MSLDNVSEEQQKINKELYDAFEQNNIPGMEAAIVQSANVNQAIKQDLSSILDKAKFVYGLTKNSSLIELLRKDKSIKNSLRPSSAKSNTQHEGILSSRRPKTR